jgi:hypothetical protein
VCTHAEFAGKKLKHTHITHNTHTHTEPFFTNESDVFRISASSLGSVRLLSQPGKSTAGEALHPSTSVELLDRFGNPLSCSYNECPKPEFGYPAEVTTRGWPVLSTSNMQVSTDIALAPGETCGGKTARPECACIAGSRTVRAVRGVAEFGCLAVGGVGPGVRIAVTVQGLSVVTDPFQVVAGPVAGFDVLRQPTAQIVSGQYFEPAVGIALMDRCGNSIREQELLVMIRDPEFDGVKQDAGLVGLTSNRTVGGIVYFTRLRATRANSNIQVCLDDTVACPPKQELPPYRLLVTGIVMDKITNLPITLTSLTATFIVINGALQKIQVQTQPFNAVQGSVMSQQPVLQLVDSYGNAVVQDQESIAITASLVGGEGCVRKKCEDYCDGTRWNGRCIKYFKKAFTFENASLQCGKWGGSLVSILDGETNDLIEAITGGDEAWMGFYAPGDAFFDELFGVMVWRWLDGSGSVDIRDQSEVFYAKWYIDSALISTDLRCAAYNVDQPGFWGALNCALEKPYICSKPLPQSQNQLSLPISGKCACCQRLLGTLSVNASKGFASFTDLIMFSEDAPGLRMHFVAHK